MGQADVIQPLRQPHRHRGQALQPPHWGGGGEQVGGAVAGDVGGFVGDAQHQLLSVEGKILSFFISFFLYKKKV